MNHSIVYNTRYKYMIYRIINNLSFVDHRSSPRNIAKILLIDNCVTVAVE